MCSFVLFYYSSRYLSKLIRLYFRKIILSQKKIFNRCKMNILLNVANAKQLSKHSVIYYDYTQLETLYQSLNMSDCGKKL